MPFEFLSCDSTQRARQREAQNSRTAEVERSSFRKATRAVASSRAGEKFLEEAPPKRTARERVSSIRIKRIVLEVHKSRSTARERRLGCRQLRRGNGERGGSGAGGGGEGVGRLVGRLLHRAGPRGHEKRGCRWRGRINQTGVKINCKTLASRVAYPLPPPSAPPAAPTAGPCPPLAVFPLRAREFRALPVNRESPSFVSLPPGPPPPRRARSASPLCSRALVGFPGGRGVDAGTAGAGGAGEDAEMRIREEGKKTTESNGSGQRGEGGGC